MCQNKCKCKDNTNANADADADVNANVQMQMCKCKCANAIYSPASSQEEQRRRLRQRRTSRKEETHFRTSWLQYKCHLEPQMSPQTSNVIGPPARSQEAQCSYPPPRLPPWEEAPWEEDNAISESSSSLRGILVFLLGRKYSGQCGKAFSSRTFLGESLRKTRLECQGLPPWDQDEPKVFLFGRRPSRLPPCEKVSGKLVLNPWKKVSGKLVLKTRLRKTRLEEDLCLPPWEGDLGSSSLGETLRKTRLKCPLGGRPWSSFVGERFGEVFSRREPPWEKV